MIWKGFNQKVEDVIEEYVETKVVEKQFDELDLNKDGKVNEDDIIEFTKKIKNKKSKKSKK
jgi:hypothetical protein